MAATLLLAPLWGLAGKSERYCRTLLQKIKEYFKKEEYQFVTVEGVCKYTDIKKEEANLFLAA